MRLVLLDNRPTPTYNTFVGLIEITEVEWWTVIKPHLMLQVRRTVRELLSTWDECAGLSCYRCCSELLRLIWNDRRSARGPVGLRVRWDSQRCRIVSAAVPAD